MLVELHIENLGVIERAALTFGPGLSALTGETGAGKTMLVEAIELVVGGRADTTVVRVGSREARVDARFLVDRDGIPTEIVLSRVIPVDGRSRAYVNGRPATVATLADEAGPLVDLHGQHAHQSLLAPAAQRTALDLFGAIDLEPLREARAEVVALEAELAVLGGDARARAREIDLLRYQVAELDAASLDDPLEDDRLATEEATLADAQGHRASGEEAIEFLRGDVGADAAIRLALRSVGGRAPFADVERRLAAAAAELDDIAADLRSATELIDEDPERLAEVRERRQTIVDLRRKYGESLEEVMSFHGEAADRLSELLDYDRRAAEIDQDLAAARQRADEAARGVREARTAAAPGLAQAAETRLRELAMPDATLLVRVGRDVSDGVEDLDLAGDHVQFLLSANPGMPPLPLQRVASGGELARTMLALRLALTDVAGRREDVVTLVFDEVDAGIGGAAAEAVGRSLAVLSERHQILVVTHLAQIAAVADAQHVVEKSVVDDQTFASVSAVTDDARSDEIARMLAGSVTEEARAHAMSMLERGARRS